MKYTLKRSGWILLFTVALTGFLYAQPARDKGIELYRQGKDREAISLLNVIANLNKKDGEVWNYLGLAYLNTGQEKNARKALQKAVKASPQNATFRSNLAYVYLMSNKLNSSQREIENALRLDANNPNAFYIRGKSYLWENKYDKAITDADKAIALKADFAEAYILKSDALLFAFGREWGETNQPLESLYLVENALEALKGCTGNCLNDRNSKIIQARLEGVEAFNSYFKQKKNKAAEPADETAVNKTPIKFFTKPQPRYTDSARRNNESGVVTLAIMFGADGNVKYVIVLQGLRYGLTEEAVRAAYNLKFEPELHDGKPVPVVKKVQYTFTIY